MKIYIGFDDTDILGADRGTGKLVRWFEQKLPDECRMWGVIRHQLPKLNGIPFTSHNSSACMVVDTDFPETADLLIQKAADHIREYFIEGSDPGVCIITENSPASKALMNFGRLCCSRIVTQKEAMTAAYPSHLSAHGGTGDGIIGAAAGVGLTLSGWSGRFVEFGRLRDYPDTAKVRQFEENGIHVLSIDRNALVPWRDHEVETCGWVRPRLWGHRPVLPVTQISDVRWRVTGLKNSQQHF
jgi:tRNA(Ile2) C34 agmatinyltransferase TiaS